MLDGAGWPRFLAVSVPLASAIASVTCSFHGSASVSPAHASASRGGCNARKVPVGNPEFRDFVMGSGLQGSFPSLLVSRGRGGKGVAVRLPHAMPDLAGTQPVLPLQPLEWVHLWPRVRSLAGGAHAQRIRADVRVAHWRQIGGSSEDVGVICFAHDIGIRPDVFDCLDHHLLFFNSPAANVTQTLPVLVRVPSTLTVKVLLDCCGAGWEGHSCHHHGGFRVTLMSSGGRDVAHTWFPGAHNEARPSTSDGFYGELPCLTGPDSGEGWGVLQDSCSALALPWSEGAGGWTKSQPKGGWGGIGREGKAGVVCGPFLVSLSVSLTHGDESRQHEAGDRKARGWDSAALRLVLGSNTVGQSHVHWVEVWESGLGSGSGGGGAGADSDECLVEAPGSGQSHRIAFPRLVRV